MICPQCQSENSTVVAFCDQCGTQLEAPCPRCGEPNRQGAKFCRRCGQAIGETPVRSSPLNVGTTAPDTYVPKHLAEKILASRHKLEGERKQVTVLFADIRGSTTLVEGLDPEEAQKLIDPVLQIMMDAVHKYEGTVNQVAGDGIMALFGAPLAHEEHALRACYAALAMQEEMRRYRQTLGPIGRIGIADRGWNELRGSRPPLHRYRYQYRIHGYRPHDASGSSAAGTRRSRDDIDDGLYLAAGRRIRSD